VLIMRFDMRAPAMSPATPADLYPAALSMAEWGEANGCAQIVLSEHHGSEDGYLPAPLLLAAAIAGRTRKLPIQIAALIVPLHDPVELAEQMAVLDLASGGRVSYVLAVGYHEPEFAMLGRRFAGRGRQMEKSIEVMRKAWSGAAFEYEGRPVQVTPLPHTPGGPGLLMGGNSAIIARRAARLGLGIIAQGANPALEEIYRAECEKLGTPPGLCINPPAGTVTAAFVAEDPDRAWAEIGPYLLHDASMYARWMGPEKAKLARQLADTPEELRGLEGPYRIFTPDEAVAHMRTSGLLVTQPLCGGIPPDLAWRSLELLERDVLPRLREGS
jgi:alkanesulfonate monooxygenase SsuD/methylene tetrahydromethanopterin reductase-like flavin-dependent oxidoreductase (luciferase family)